MARLQPTSSVPEPGRLTSSCTDDGVLTAGLPYSSNAMYATRAVTRSAHTLGVRSTAFTLAAASRGTECDALTPGHS